MIESLTEEQIAKFPEYVKKWTDIGLCTDPANRPEAEKAINKCYELAGLKRPEKIVWCGSPLSQGLVRSIITNENIMKEIGSKISIGDSVRESVRQSVMDSVVDPVWNSVVDPVWDSVGASVWDSVRASVWASVGASVWDSVGASVRASVGASVRASVGASVRASVGASVWASSYGSHDADFLSFYSFFRNELKLTTQTDKITGLTELANHCGWILPHENICFASERHCILNRDERGRLHSISDPAIMYPDGWKIYAIHGVRVPEYIVTNPEQITIDKIDSEKNAEIRRIMIDIYGAKNYIENCGATLIHNDKYGKLYKKVVEDDEDIVMVKVINSTSEPDGTFKEYYLRVPPNIERAHQAVAWTFGKTEKTYNPLLET